MKTLSYQQPWAYLVAAGIKPIENRTWKLPEKYKGQRVLIHASAKPINFDFAIEGQATSQEIEILSALNYCDENDLYGAIIGSVEIVDCVINHSSMWAEKTDIPTLGDVLDDLKLLGRVVPPKKIIYNWILANPILFPEPIPTKGKLSFWDYPNILAEPEEKDGELFCHCQLPVKEINQVIGGCGDFRCVYCGGKWYK